MAAFDHISVEANVCEANVKDANASGQSQNVVNTAKGIL
jgi:hypothetical protein